MASKSISSDITNYCASIGIEWSFIPERAPNLGGLVQIGDLVLIKDEKIFHCQWPFAQVIKVFPGEDGRVRVADVKTWRGINRRPTNKLVVLLTQEETISQDAPSGGSMVEPLPSGTLA